MRSYVVKAGLVLAITLGPSGLLACGSDDAPGNNAAAAPAPSNTVTPAPTASVDSGTEPPPPPCDEAKMASIQKSFADEAIPNDVGAVAVVKDRSCGARYFTRGASRDVPENALHLIGSATKPYVASLVLLLAEEGKLSLSDPASKWITGVPGGDAVKVRHLLDHTSGIYNFTGDFSYVLGMILGLKTKYTPRQLVDMGFAKPVSFAAGTPDKWEYSNTNYTMLGMIIESVTGKSVAEVLRERILTPIGAKATFFNGPEKPVGEFAPSTTFNGSAGATFMDPSASWSVGNIAATIGDLADWTEKRGSGAFHSAAMQAELTKGAPTGAGFTYGAAAVIVPEGSTILNGNGPAIGHGGDTPGYHTQALYFPKPKATIVMVMQSDKGPTGSFPLAATYLEALYDALVNPYFGTTPKPKTP